MAGPLSADFLVREKRKFIDYQATVTGGLSDDLELKGAVAANQLISKFVTVRRGIIRRTMTV